MPWSRRSALLFRSPCKLSIMSRRRASMAMGCPSMTRISFRPKHHHERTMAKKRWSVTLHWRTPTDLLLLAGFGGSKLPSVKIHGAVSGIHNQFPHALLQGRSCPSLGQESLTWSLQAMTPPDAASESVPADAIERIDDEESEVIMMDPKNYYMVYLLKTSAFLHSCVAFLMMISYYKLKVGISPCTNVVLIIWTLPRFRWWSSSEKRRSRENWSSKAPGSLTSRVKPIRGSSPTSHVNGTNWWSVRDRFLILTGTSSSRRKCEINTRTSSISMNWVDFSAWRKTKRLASSRSSNPSSRVSGESTLTNGIDPFHCSTDCIRF